MKKSLLSLVASLFLLCSAAANAGVIASLGTSGSPGDSVRIDVSLESGNISYGGDFTVSFDMDKLTFDEIVGRSDNLYDFSAITVTSPLITGYTFSLAYLGLPSPADAPIDPIFSIWFLIKSDYPALVFPDITIVTISEVLIDALRDEKGNVLYDENGNEYLRVAQILQFIEPTVVVQRNDGTIPEPGALALVGLALLIMTGVGRRNRMNRG